MLRCLSKWRASQQRSGACTPTELRLLLLFPQVHFFGRPYFCRSSFALRAIARQVLFLRLGYCPFSSSVEESQCNVKSAGAKRKLSGWGNPRYACFFGLQESRHQFVSSQRQPSPKADSSEFVPLDLSFL
ncbi:MAG: hypothetical protein SW833_03945 [Cyanobacteriota bacterium]|nr:hypothetical protein [Cyanobacteriota bacterium]